MKRSLHVFLLVTLLFSLLFSANVFAAEKDDDGIPMDHATYTLTYPDGTTVTTKDYDEAVQLQKEEKLLGTYKTDEERRILLQGYVDNGTIRIYEKEVPAGYTSQNRNTEVELSTHEITIVNSKIKSDEDDNTSGDATGTGKQEPGSKQPIGNVTHPRKTIATGDQARIALFAFLGSVALILVIGMSIHNKHARKRLIAIVLVAGTLAFTGMAESHAENSVSSDNTFTINKVDDSQEPLADVEFEVYGKPALSYEEEPSGLIFHKEALLTTSESFGSVSDDTALRVRTAERDELKIRYAQLISLEAQIAALVQDTKDLSAYEAEGVPAEDIQMFQERVAAYGDTILENYQKAVDGYLTIQDRLTIAIIESGAYEADRQYEEEHNLPKYSYHENAWALKEAGYGSAVEKLHDGIDYSDAVFELYDKDGNYVKDITVSVGQPTTVELKPGEYTLKEKVYPEYDFYLVSVLSMENLNDDLESVKTDLINLKELNSKIQSNIADCKDGGAYTIVDMDAYRAHDFQEWDERGSDPACEYAEMEPIRVTVEDNQFINAEAMNLLSINSSGRKVRLESRLITEQLLINDIKALFP